MPRDALKYSDLIPLKATPFSFLARSDQSPSAAVTTMEESSADRTVLFYVNGKEVCPTVKRKHQSRSSHMQAGHAPLYLKMVTTSNSIMEFEVVTGCLSWVRRSSEGGRARFSSM